MDTRQQKVASLAYQRGMEAALSDFGLSKIALEMLPDTTATTYKLAQGMPPQGAPMQPGMQPGMDPSMQQPPQPSPEEMEMQAKQMKLDAENAMMQARQMKSQKQESEQQAAGMQQGMTPIQAQEHAAAQPNLADMQAQQDELKRLRSEQAKAQPAPPEQQAQPMPPQQQPAPQPAPEQQQAEPQGPPQGQDPMAMAQQAFEQLVSQGVPQEQAQQMVLQYLQQMGVPLG